MEALVLLGVLALLCEVFVPIEFSTGPGSGTAARIFACKSNLKLLYDRLLLHQEKFGAVPSEPGPKFLLSLWTAGVVPHDETHRDLFLCPGVPGDPDGARIRQTPIAELWTDLARVTGDDTHYAGRNTADPSVPRAALSSRSCLAADDNEHGPNHADGTTNYLTGDGAVREARRVDLIEDGLLPAGAQYITVGPGAPIPELRQVIAR